MAFPITSVLDNFTGTNGDDLQVYSANWASPPTGGVAMEIQSNAATGTSAGGNNTNFWTTSFGPDFEVYATISTKPADGNIVLLFGRGLQETSLATADGYCLRFAPAAGTDTISIQRLDNGAQTTLGAAISQEVSAGDAIGLDVNGSTLRAYYKSSGGSWGQIGTDRTDTTYTAAGKVGMFTSSTGVRIDDFGAGTTTQWLTPSVFTNTQTFYGPTVSVGAVTLAPTLVTNSQTFYGATVSSTYELTPGLLTNTQTFYAPTVGSSYTLSPPLVTNTSTFYAATVSPGAVTLQPQLVTNEQTFYSPTVLQQSNVELLPSLVTNEQVFFAALVELQSEKQGGDDAYHHTGWNKKAWKKKQKWEEALEETIRKTYLKVQGVEPTPAEVAEVVEEVKEYAPEVIKPEKFDYSGVMEWLQVQEARVAEIIANQQEEDDEEALLLLL